MIDPHQFYSDNDTPNERIKQNIWIGISNTLFPKKYSRSFILDRRSFVYGIAASFILMFTSIGIYSTFSRIIEVAQPKEIRAEKAYQTAIHEFENIVFSKESGGAASENKAYNALRNTQLHFLNEAINELHQETNSHDLSPLKRQRLHELYNIKLTVLQEIIQQGKFDL